MPLLLANLTGLALLILGLPVALAIVAVPILYLLADPVAPMLVLPQRMFGAMDSFPLMAVPFFVLVGFVMNTGGITNRIFRFANALVGHVRGGLGHVNIMASLLMSGMSGSAVADTSGLGQVEIEVMKKEGYDPAFAAAITASSATIGPIIPPSIPLVIIGAVTSTSISQLLLAGLLPGLLMAAALALVVAYVARRDGYPSRPRATMGELVRAFLDAFPALMAPVLLLGGILSGVFTATEASAVAAIYAILVATLWYRELSLAQLWGTLVSTAITVGAIFLVIAAAATLSWLMTWMNVPQTLAANMGPLAEHPWLLMLAILGILLFLGLFLESNAAIILVSPLLFPIAVSSGIDPVHFGTVVVLALMIGLLTPPIGLNMFIVMAIAGIGMRDYLRATWPFMLILVVSLLIVAFVPWLSLAIPTYFFR